MAKRNLNDTQIDKLGVGSHRVPQLAGLYLRCRTAGGVKAFWVIKRGLDGKLVQIKIGERPTTTVDEAVEKALHVLKAVKDGGDVRAARNGRLTFKKVAGDWFEDHVKDAERTLRSASFIEGNLKNHLAAWDARAFDALHRGDVMKLLDKVKKSAGPSAADKVLNILSRIFRWYHVRHPKYINPLADTRGMRVISTKERARKRVLDDDELRAIWKTAEANGQFGALVRLLLLTGQRREKVAAMKWEDIDTDGVWTIPADAREKGNAGKLALPPVALEILGKLNRFEGNPYVFATARGDHHFSGYSKSKAAFNKKAGVTDWRLHDLRRTARSLLSRAGVSSEHAERVLGHAIRGVEGVYDRHSYEQEKGHALAQLAGLIDNIVRERGDKVVHLKKGRR
jgi:integrase